MRTMQSILTGLVFISLVSVAFGIPSIITFDENGNGTFLDGTTLPWTIGPDPGPGGLPNALIYLPPFGTSIAGDVMILEPTTGELSDLVRFNAVAGAGDGAIPGAMIVFYSDFEPGVPNPEPADVGLPTENYPNPIVMTEQGTEENNWVDYTPLPGQPGYLDNYPGTTYHIISDVPEPSTLILLGAGIVSLLVFTWRRR